MWLQAEGFESVYVLENGLEAWKQAGYPTVSANLQHSSQDTSSQGATSQDTSLDASVSAEPAPTESPSIVQTASHADTFLPGLARSFLADDSGPTSKELTVLFVDIANSTDTIVGQPPEVALDFVQRFMSVVTKIALEYCGDVKDYEGDGALLYFESVTEATQAALAMRQALARLPADGQAELQARFSLNVGDIIVGVIGVALRRSVALIGPSINLASRLLKHIPPGGIIATDVVIERLRQETPTLAHYFQLLDEELELKGFEKEVVTAYHAPPGELQQQLEGQFQKSQSFMPEGFWETLDRTNADLAQTGALDRGLQVGDTAPDFRLPNVSGSTVTLSEILGHGPAVVTFYRGEW